VPTMLTNRPKPVDALPEATVADLRAGAYLAEPDGSVVYRIVMEPDRTPSIDPRRRKEHPNDWLLEHIVERKNGGFRTRWATVEEATDLLLVCGRASALEPAHQARVDQLLAKADEAIAQGPQRPRERQQPRVRPLRSRP
jgi:hypothetical protein